MTTGLLLVQYTAEGTVRAGVRHDGVVRALPRNWPDTVLAILDAWPEWNGQLGLSIRTHSRSFRMPGLSLPSPSPGRSCAPARTTTPTPRR